MARLRDSGLDGMKASVEYCPECRKQTVHYTSRGGWPICHACGYNEEMEKISKDNSKDGEQRRWPWQR